MYLWAVSSAQGFGRGRAGWEAAPRVGRALGVSWGVGAAWPRGARGAGLEAPGPPGPSEAGSGEGGPGAGSGRRRGRDGRARAVATSWPLLSAAVLPRGSLALPSRQSLPLPREPAGAQTADRPRADEAPGRLRLRLRRPRAGLGGTAPGTQGALGGGTAGRGRAGAPESTG